MIAIVGAGAMGGWLATELKLAGHDVVIVDVSEPLVEAINEDGLLVEEMGSTRTTRPKAVTHCEDLGFAEIVFFFVKAHHTLSAANTAKSLVGPSTTVVTLQNGWGNADVLATCFDHDRIVVGVTYHSATVKAVAHVAHTGKGMTFVGPYVDEKSLDDANRVSKLLTSAGIESTVTAQVKTEIWKKLILNAATLPTAALSRLCAGELGKPSDTLEVVDALTREAVNVALAQGYDIELSERLERIHAVLEGAGKGKASMLQDIEGQRKTEIEVVNGAIVRAAKIIGMDVPLNWAMVGLIHGLERSWKS